MFGGWSSNFSQISDLSGNLQKLKVGLEAGLQDSGLLGPGEAPKSDVQLLSASTQQKAPEQALQNKVVVDSHAQPASQSVTGSVQHSQHSQAIAEIQHPEEDRGLHEAVPSGWDHEELDLVVPESDANDLHIPAEAATHASLQSQEAPQIPLVQQPSEQLPSGAALDLQQGDAEERLPSPKTAFPVPEAEEGPLHPPDLEAELPKIEALPEDSSPQVLPEAAAQAEEAVDKATLVVEPSHTSESIVEDSVLPNGNLPSEAEGAARQESGAELEGEGEVSTADAPQQEAVPPQITLPEPNSEDPSTRQESSPALGNAASEDLDAMERSELQELAKTLRHTLKLRESQLETKFREVTSMQEVTQQLMARNEELARKASKTSEEDVKLLTDEFEARVGAAERKVYALSKERDMLRRNAEKLNSATDLVKEKDNIIAQVMAEGEQLSKKQLTQENTIKKLRQQIKDVELSRKELAAESMAVRKQLEEAQSSKQRTEEELSAAKASHKAELDSEVSHYRDLLTKARSAQVEAEEKAAVSAKEGLSKKLRDAEQRAEMLQDQITELEMSLERQRAAADAREERLNRELADMERRSQEEQSRHDELTGNLPDATRPLLRQIEGMQRTAEAHADAWRATEESLQLRLADTEARCAAAGEKVRVANEQAQSATRRANTASAALDSLRDEYDSLQDRYDTRDEQYRAVRLKEQKLVAQIGQLQSRVASLEEDMRNSERQYLKRLDSELQSSRKAVQAAESRASALEEQLSNSSSTNPGPSGQPRLAGPPALAGPGHKWVLVKNGEEASVREGRPNGVALASKSSFSSQFMGTATELEALREALQQREEQVASCQATIQQLELTRDSLSEELVSLSQIADQHSRAFSQLQQLQEAYQKAEQRLLACTELLGEREEKILELSADIDDMKALYRDQLEFVLGEFSGSASPSGAASSVQSWTAPPDG